MKLRLIIDSDAFIHGRALGFCAECERAVAGGTLELLLMEYARKKELRDLRSCVDAMGQQGLLKFERFLPTESKKTRKRWEQLDGVHPGEREAIAFASLAGADAPLFVSVDAAARKVAKSHGVTALDLMDLAVLCVELDILTRSRAQTLLEPWSDPSKEIGRPKDYTGFDETYASRVPRIRTLLG